MSQHCLHFMHLAYAFIQSNLQYIQVIHLFFVSMCSLGFKPITFALLTQYSTTEPQEHVICKQELIGGLSGLSQSDQHVD